VMLRLSCLSPVEFLVIAMEADENTIALIQAFL
jgi:hypothetical protein